MATRKKSAPRKSARAKPVPVKKPPRKHQEELLDEALEESFPASDPLPVDPGVVHVSDATTLSVGDRAPDFALKATPDQTISLRQLLGKPIVLVFYPADWSPVCGDQVSLYNEMLSEFQEYGAQVVGISVDGAWCHTAFAKDRKLRFPLLADFEPKGAVAKRYGVYDKESGTTQRALFVIDGEGRVRWKYVSPVGINPGADGILDALDTLPRVGNA
jgi:peroxiredoxin